MGTVISVPCLGISRHDYEKTSIHFTVDEWDGQTEQFIFLQNKLRAVGVEHPKVHSMVYAYVRRFLKHTVEADIYCEVSGNLKAGTNIEVLVL